MLTVFGVKPVRLIETVTVADDAGAASTRASVETANKITLRIFGTPLSKRVVGSFPACGDFDACGRLKVRKRFGRMSKEIGALQRGSDLTGTAPGRHFRRPRLRRARRWRA